MKDLKLLSPAEAAASAAEAAAAATLLLTLDPMTYLSRIAAASFKLSLARSSPSVKYWLTYGNKTLSSGRN
jgi:hypothetical protein